MEGQSRSIEAYESNSAVNEGDDGLKLNCANASSFM